MNPIVAFSRLPAQKRVMALEAALCLALARVIVRHVPMRYWYRAVSSTVRSGGLPEQRALGRDVGRTVRRIAQRLPFETACLPRAMTAHWMLRRRGVSSRLVFGVRRATRGRNLEYHAWLTVDGQCVVGGRGITTYVTLRSSRGTAGFW